MFMTGINISQTCLPESIYFGTFSKEIYGTVNILTGTH